MTTTAPRPTPAAPPGRRGRRAPATNGWRAATAMAPLVTRRRARDDAGLLALTATLLAWTVLLSAGLPRLEARAADEAVRRIVAEAGVAADVVVTLPTRAMIPDPQRDPDQPALIANAAGQMASRLPTAVRAATRAPVTAVHTAPGVVRIDGDGQLVRLAHLGSADLGADPLVRWVDGAAPGVAPAVPSTPPVDPAQDGQTPEGEVQPAAPAVRPEVRAGLAATTAEQLGITVGTRFDLTTPGAGATSVLVTGLYEPIDPTADQWRGFDDLLRPQPAPSAGHADHRIAFLLSDDSLPDAVLAVVGPAVQRAIRFPADPSSLDDALAARTADQLDALTSAPADLATPDGVPAVDTQLHEVLADAAGRLAAARAQASVLIVGLGVVGALALVLAARLLVARRESLLVAERARGASVASVVVRALAESVPVAIGAAALGVAAALLALPGPTSGLTVAATVTAVAVLAPAVASALVVRRAWTGARQPANRSDRERIARRKGARRATAEIAFVALAVAAVVSVRGRGLLPSDRGVDPLLAAAPALLAAAATVVAARVLPPVLRLLSRATARRRGLVGVVATARAARASGTMVPLLTLTTAVALVVFCGTVAVTVRDGQAVAAEVVVGADVRVDGRLTVEQVDALRGAPGLTAAAAATEQLGRSFGTSSGVKARLVIVDTDDLARILADRGEPVDGWDELSTASADGLPTLLDPDLVRTAQIIEPEFMAAEEFVPLDVRGTVASLPRFPVSDEEPDVAAERALQPVFVVDRTLLEQVTGKAVQVTTVLLDGPGARDAVAAAGLDDVPGVDVTVRDTWLDQARTSPIGAGLALLLLGSAVVLALYAAVALALTVVATSRERGRTLSALRTQGLDARTARALTLGELAPLAVTAVLLGTAIGIAVPWALTDALGLDLLTGAPGTAELQLSWWPVVGAAAVVALSLVVAVLVESAAHRRERLGEVLRVGER